MPKYRLNRLLDDVAALRAMTKHVELQSVTMLVGSDVKEYWFSEIAMDADDGDIFVKPTDIAVDDPGRWVLMSKTNPDGGGGGSSEGTTLSNYQAEELAVDDEETRLFELAPLVDQAEVYAGVLVHLKLTTPGSPGHYLVELFKDADRTSKISGAFDFDTTIQDWSDVAIGYVAVDPEDPVFYGRVTNLSGGTSDVTIDAKLAVIAAVDDVTVQQVSAELAANPGLELAAGLLRVKAAVGLVRDAAGISVDDTVVMKLTGDQTATGRKFFEGVGLTPRGEAGPPSTGTWEVGTIILDAGGIYWRCWEAGTPGEWSLFQGKFYDGQPGTHSGSPDPDIDPETSKDGIFDIGGNHSLQARLRIWGLITAAIAADFPFRLELFSKSTRLRQDRIIQLNGMIRMVETSGVNAAGQTTLNVNDHGQIFLGDLVYLVDDTLAHAEFAGVTARLTGPTRFTLESDLVNAYADNSHVCLVTEFNNIFCWNNDVTEGGDRKIYWRFHHDGLVAESDPALEYLYMQLTHMDQPPGAP